MSTDCTSHIVQTPVGSQNRPHITVCICTYKRPRLLRELLEKLAAQETSGKFTYSVVVVDNDQARSAEPVVAEFARASAVTARYCNEARQNIALARNMAVANAAGEFLAFVDDDELPTPQWLLTLYSACGKYGVDGVLGPVKPQFEANTPAWVIKGGFYDRATYPTGYVIDRNKGRTGNVLLRRRLFTPGEEPFRPEFRTGEDQDFFGRMIEKGHRFIWCNEALAYEVVPPQRWKRSFMLKRALLGGAVTLKDPNFGMRDIVKSVIAVLVYTLAAPFAFIAGQHRFMNVLIRLFDHLGKLLALVGIKPIKAAYVTE